jgi:hypothetical protein
MPAEAATRTARDHRVYLSKIRKDRRGRNKGSREEKHKIESRQLYDRDIESRQLYDRDIEMYFKHL